MWWSNSGRSEFRRALGRLRDPTQTSPARFAMDARVILFVTTVVVFTILAATYQPADPLRRSGAKMESFLSSTSSATFRREGSVVRTGEDFLSSSDLAANAALPKGANDVPAGAAAVSADTIVVEGCDLAGAVHCSAPEVLLLLMRYAMEQLKDVHFLRFGKPVPGGEAGDSCDLAWRFRPKGAKRSPAAFYKDYRRFVIRRDPDCSHSVASMGEYHSGPNGRGNKNKNKNNGTITSPSGGGDKSDTKGVVPIVGESVNDSLPAVGSEKEFVSGKYLVYAGGRDRCETMDHYLWSFLCALGEAQYLNRTLVMDLSVCLAGMYTSSNLTDEGKDFRFYFDFEHLRDAASVMDQRLFWNDWDKWQQKHNLALHLVEDVRVTPNKLQGVNAALIMRKFGDTGPDGYWYRVCEGEAEAVVRRPWHLVWKSPRLKAMASAIAAKMGWDFDAVHVVRGEKAQNTALWPNLNADTSPGRLLETLKDRIDEGRSLYIATNERDQSFFNPLRDRYSVHLLDEFKELWGEGSEWYEDTKRLNGGVAVEFDGYMRQEVDTEVFLRGKKQLETFNDLTADCKDGINTCSTGQTTASLSS